MSENLNPVVSALLGLALGTGLWFALMAGISRRARKDARYQPHVDAFLELWAGMTGKDAKSASPELCTALRRMIAEFAKFPPAEEPDILIVEDVPAFRRVRDEGKRLISGVLPFSANVQ